jgi:hypothetical protein
MNTQPRNRRVVFTMGGKGGVGKTGLMVALAEWFEANEIPFTLLDLDTENKARGSLKHFFNGSVVKVNIHTPASLDTFVDHLESGAAIVLADMGAGSGQVASDWFDSMYEDISSHQTRQALRVFWHGRIDCKIGRSMLSSRTPQVPNPTSATGTRLSKQFVSAKRCRRLSFEWNFVWQNWKTQRGNTVSALARLRQGRMRSTN